MVGENEKESNAKNRNRIFSYMYENVMQSNMIPSRECFLNLFNYVFNLKLLYILLQKEIIDEMSKLYSFSSKIDKLVLIPLHLIQGKKKEILENIYLFVFPFIIQVLVISISFWNSFIYLFLFKVISIFFLYFLLIQFNKIILFKLSSLLIHCHKQY